MSLKIKEPKNLDNEQIDCLFTQVVSQVQGVCFAKPISKQPISGGGERSVVELYLPPKDFFEKKRYQEKFNSLSGLASINQIVSNQKSYEKWLAESNARKLRNQEQKPQEEWIME